MNKLILVRYGELNTKGKNRKLFIRQLKNNIAKMLHNLSNVEYQFNYDRGYIYCDENDFDQVNDVLAHTFGIVSYSSASIVSQDNEEIFQKSCEILKNHYRPNMTFKVSVKRADKTFPISSMEFAHQVASRLLQNFELKVDLSNPDYHLEIDIRDGRTYIFDQRHKGLEGYPVGINGKALVMLSGGIDSPVAAFLTMKRGVEIECIHFASPPYTSKRAYEKVVSLCEVLAKYQPQIKLHNVPFTDIQKTIFDHVNTSYAMMVMRHQMYDLASEVAFTIKAQALVNGECLGQVASQTLKNMVYIDQVCKRLIIRPLVCLDKNEIIALAKKIKTYEISILPFEDCCTIFKVDNPSTNVNPKIVEQFEQRFNRAELISETLTKIEVETICLNNVDELF